MLSEKGLSPSGYPVAGVLSQGEIGKDRSIAYTSQVLRGPELKYEVYEKEALAVLQSQQLQILRLW